MTHDPMIGTALAPVDEALVKEALGAPPGTTIRELRASDYAMVIAVGRNGEVDVHSEVGREAITPMVRDLLEALEALDAH